MTPKKIIKLAVGPGAKQAIERMAEKFDMKEHGVASRIYEWFDQQSDDLQRAILGLYGDRTPDIARLVWEEMAAKRMNGKRESEGEPPPARAVEPARPRTKKDKRRDQAA